MSIEALKQQARRHEQNEEWQKALDQYKKAINALAQDDQTDIGLINRVGDLFVRVGALDNAVKHYEQAVDLYREAFLPNNAIAVCKKIIRNVPGHHHAYLKIGQIRAEQGFLPDARTNFLTYAERMQQAGDLDESFRALVEFCDLAPDDVDVRITVAEQMAHHEERTGEAVDQLLVAYRHLVQSGDNERAAEVEAKIKELDPSVDVGSAMAAASGFGGFGGFGGEESDLESQFGEIDLSRSTVEDYEEAPAAAEVEVADEGGFEIMGSAAEDEASESLEEAAEDEGFELPMMGFGDSEDEDEEEEEEEGVELPMMGFDDSEDEDEDEEEDGVELPMMGFDDSEDEDEEEEEEGVELPMMGFGDSEDEEEEEEGVELPTMDFDDEPDTSALDIGFGEEVSAESSEALEEAIEEAAPEPAMPEPAPPPPAAAEPPPPAAPAPPAPAAPAAPAGDWVDLGAMIFGGGGGGEKTTRFKVAYEEPTGDEEADFAKMLSQFKEKVSENLDSGDVRAHYDLGTAYKEMGLLEEAISSFQQALRASADHLPTYELMGQTFMDMGQPEAAVRTLQRALQVGSSVEDEFLGIYYHLARAFEALGRRESALEFYDRVFALDINFADVTERLRELR